MRTGTTITLARDVAPGGNVVATEAALLDDLRALIADRTVIEPPEPYKTGHDGEYRKMRDREGQKQYTEVRVRAYVE